MDGVQYRGDGYVSCEGTFLPFKILEKMYVFLSYDVSTKESYQVNLHLHMAKMVSLILHKIILLLNEQSAEKIGRVRVNSLDFNHAVLSFRPSTLP